MTDSTTAEGWMQKSYFVKKGEDPIQATTCRCGTEICIDFYGRERKRIQSVVYREIEQRCGRSLEGLAPRRQRTHLTLTLPLSRIDARKFPNITAAQQDQLVAHLLAAAASQE